MTKGVKYFLILAAVVLAYWLQRSLLVDWGWLAGFNLIVSGCLFLTIINHPAVWLWVVAGGILLDSAAVLPFGAHLILLAVVVWVLKLLLREVFSHLSWGASLALAAGGVGLYYLLLLLIFASGAGLGIMTYRLMWDWTLARGFLQTGLLNFLLIAVALTIYRWRRQEYIVYDQGPFWHSG